MAGGIRALREQQLKARMGVEKRMPIHHQHIQRRISSSVVVALRWCGNFD
jgi:hypothetical protein